MYVVGAYPKFLKANWNFLKTVVKKLFEFMKEPFPGVMDMACNTFLTISQKCRDEFIKCHLLKESTNQLEKEPYINELIRKYPEEIFMLDTNNRCLFFEAIGYMINAEQDIGIQDKLITDLLQQLLQQLWEIINSAGQATDAALVMRNEGNLDKLIYFLKINERVAFSVGYSYFIFFSKFKFSN